MQLQHLPLKRLHPPKCSPDKNTTPFRILQRLRRIPQLSILQRQPSRSHGKVRESIIALGIFGIDKVIIGIEHGVGDLGTDFAGVVGGIEAGDGVEGGDAVDDVLEEVFVSDAAAGDYAEAGYYDSFFFGV